MARKTCSKISQRSALKSVWLIIVCNCRSTLCVYMRLVSKSADFSRRWKNKRDEWSTVPASPHHRGWRRDGTNARTFATSRTRFSRVRSVESSWSSLRSFRRPSTIPHRHSHTIDRWHSLHKWIQRQRFPRSTWSLYQWWQKMDDYW